MLVMAKNWSNCLRYSLLLPSIFLPEKYEKAMKRKFDQFSITCGDFRTENRGCGDFQTFRKGCGEMCLTAFNKNGPKSFDFGSNQPNLR